jgi:hypothetical protein
MSSSKRPKRANPERGVTRSRHAVPSICKVQCGSIVLTPENAAIERLKLVTDPRTGLRITKSPDQMNDLSEDVLAAMLDLR